MLPSPIDAQQAVKRLGTVTAANVAKARESLGLSEAASKKCHERCYRAQVTRAKLGA